MASRRFIVYFIAIFALTAALTLAEVRLPGSLRLHELPRATDVHGTSEYSPVEILQAGSLVISGLLMAAVARSSRTFRTLAIAIGGTDLLFLIRELDYFLDRFLFDNLWEVLLAISGALLLAYLYRHQRRLWLGLARAWPSPGLTLLFAGVTILLAISLLVGHEPLWQSILGEHYRRAGKLAVEEFMEFAGYCLWFVGSIEFAVEVREHTTGQQKADRQAVKAGSD